MNIHKSSYDCNRLFQYADRAERDVQKLLEQQLEQQQELSRISPSNTNQLSRNNELHESTKFTTLKNDSMSDTGKNGTSMNKDYSLTMTTMTFGHPDPPNICIFPLKYGTWNENNEDDDSDDEKLNSSINNNSSNINNRSSKSDHKDEYYDNDDDYLTLLVAYTEHTITGQLVVTSSIGSSYPTTNTSSANNNNNKKKNSIDGSILSNCFNPVAIKDAKINPETIVTEIAPMEIAILVNTASENDSYDVDQQSDDYNHLRGIDEKITSLVVVELEHPEWLFENSPSSSRSIECTSASSRGNNVDDPIFIDDDANDPSPASSQQRKRLSQQYRVSVVFGTNCNHVFAVELTITGLLSSDTKNCQCNRRSFKWNMQRSSFPVSKTIHSSSTIFEVLPRNSTVSPTPLKSSSSFCHSHHIHYSMSCNPWGGVSSISSYRILDQPNVAFLNDNNSHGNDTDNDGDTATSLSFSSSTSEYVFITYGDGTIVRIHHGICFPSIWGLRAITMPSNCSTSGYGNGNGEKNQKYDQLSFFPKSLNECLIQLSHGTIEAPIVCGTVRLPYTMTTAATKEIRMNSQHKPSFSSSSFDIPLPLIVPLPQYFASPMVLPYSTIIEQHQPNIQGPMRRRRFLHNSMANSMDKMDVDKSIEPLMTTTLKENDDEDNDSSSNYDAYEIDHNEGDNVYNDESSKNHYDWQEDNSRNWNSCFNFPNVEMEALVFGRGSLSSSDVMPTFCFYTSERHFIQSSLMAKSAALNYDVNNNRKSRSLLSHQHKPINKTNSISFDDKMGSEKEQFNNKDSNGSYALGSVTKVLLGSAIGAIRWGFGSSSVTKTSPDSPNISHSLIGSSSYHGTSTTLEEGHNNSNNQQKRSSLDTRSCHGKLYQSPTMSSSSPSFSTMLSSKSLESSSEIFQPLPLHWGQSRPIELFPGVEFHDVPRQIESCVVDPDGTFAAVADTLGRVMLIDLLSKQIVRIWKGYRDATCCWHYQTVLADDDVRMSFVPTLHIVIHSRKRRIVEVWKISRHQGSRVLSKQVGRDAQIISCTERHSHNRPPDGDNNDDDWLLSTCYILHSRITGTSLNHLERIDLEAGMTTTTKASMSTMNAPLSGRIPPPSTSETSVLTRFSYARQQSDSSVLSSSTNASHHQQKRLATLRLQHLQQLLSTTNVEFTIDDIDRSLRDIKSLNDLGTALDLLATAKILEERLGVLESSSFHKNAIAYCTEVLNLAMSKVSNHHSEAFTKVSNHPLPNYYINENVRILSHKIQYHTQIVQAFDALDSFQVKNVTEISSQPTKAPSQWAAESMAWAKTFEQVTGRSLDSGLVGSDQSLNDMVTFTKFASCCAFPVMQEDDHGVRGTKVAPLRRKVKVYFNESSRTRREILQSIFRPLVVDVFSYNVIYSILDNLGICDDSNYIQKCFGEWFMTVPLRAIYTKGLYSENPPMARLLLDLAKQDIESSHFIDSNSSCSSNRVVLSILHSFCEESTDLVRAFMLATMCWVAVSSVVTKKEAATYGKVQSTELINHWTTLLRKLRVCLLVTLRLNSLTLSAPVSINSVDEDGLFSVFEWLALDELQMTHEHQQIVALERACATSSYSFDPSLPEGDGPKQFKILQNSCLSAAISEDERSEYLVDFEDDDRFGALLLFLGSHNIPPILAAHRALLLAAKWSSNPDRQDCLKDCLASLKALRISPGLESLAVAVCLEVWQSRICPFYRAQLFGFFDVHELSEDIVAPLLKSHEWLNGFGKISLQLLEIMCDFKDEVDSTEVLKELLGNSNQLTWPQVKVDHILRRLLDKIRPIEPSSFDAHSVVVCALLISRDIDSLVQCVPSIYESFIPNALFHAVTTSSNVRELQKGYLDDALFRMARDYSGPAMENFELAEIHTLAKVWNFDLKSVHTLFLLAMYEYGKDRVVDELLTKATAMSSTKINVRRLVDGGVDIACRRLNMYLHGNLMHTAGMHGVLGLLDANLCEWIQHRAEGSLSLVETPELGVPIGCTHLFVMRLLSLSNSNTSSSSSGSLTSLDIVDPGLRAMIQSMVVLSGILVKAFSTNFSNR